MAKTFKNNNSLPFNYQTTIPGSSCMKTKAWIAHAQTPAEPFLDSSNLKMASAEGADDWEALQAGRVSDSAAVQQRCGRDRSLDQWEAADCNWWVLQGPHKHPGMYPPLSDSDRQTVIHEEESSREFRYKEGHHSSEKSFTFRCEMHSQGFIIFEFQLVKCK